MIENLNHIKYMLKADINDILTGDFKFIFEIVNLINSFN